MSSQENVHFLSDKEGLQVVLEKTGLKEKELERIVGRFGRQSAHYNALRGKLITTPSGRLEIRDNYNNRLYWPKPKNKPYV